MATGMKAPFGAGFVPCAVKSCVPEVGSLACPSAAKTHT